MTWAGDRDLAREAEELAAKLPPVLAPLAQMAFNYRWSWAPGGPDLFRDIDPYRWGMQRENPVRLLLQAPAESLIRAANNADLLQRADRVHRTIKEEMDTVGALQQVGIVRRPDERFGGGLQQKTNGVLPLHTPAVRIDVSEQVGPARCPRPSVVESHLRERSENRRELRRELLGLARQVTIPCPGHRPALRTRGKASGPLFTQPEQGSNRRGGTSTTRRGFERGNPTRDRMGCTMRASSKTFIPSMSLPGAAG